MARRRAPGLVVRLTVGGRPVESLSPGEAARLRRQVAQALWPAAVGYAEAEWAGLPAAEQQRVMRQQQRAQQRAGA